MDDMCEGCEKAPATTFDSEGIPLCEECATSLSEGGDDAGADQVPEESSSAAPQAYKAEEERILEDKGSAPNTTHVRQKKREDVAFVQGYVCAVANLIMLHDEPTIAKDVLNPVTPVNWKIIDEYDRDVLAKVGLAPKRRKSKKGNSVE